jgi:hypothetical protein
LFIVAPIVYHMKLAETIFDGKHFRLKIIFDFSKDFCDIKRIHKMATSILTSVKTEHGTINTVYANRFSKRDRIGAF